MSLLEWLGEGFTPQDVGSVQFGRGDEPPRSPAVVWVRFFIAAAILAGVYYLAFASLHAVTWQAVGVVLGTTLVYLLAAYFIRAQADTSNIGWLGGLIDHPFRYSDDLNRFLLFLQIVLWPGRFLAESLVDTVRLVWRGGGSDDE